MLKCRVFGGKTGPFPVGRVFRVVRTVAMVRIWVEPEPEPTWEFGPVANTWLEYSPQYFVRHLSVCLLLLIQLLLRNIAVLNCNRQESDQYDDVH
jgi:hypothetical protein